MPEITRKHRFQRKRFGLNITWGIFHIIVLEMIRKTCFFLQQIQFRFSFNNDIYVRKNSTGIYKLVFVLSLCSFQMMQLFQSFRCRHPREPEAVLHIFTQNCQ